MSSGPPCRAPYHAAGRQQCTTTAQHSASATCGVSAPQFLTLPSPQYPVTQIPGGNFKRAYSFVQRLLKRPANRHGLSNRLHLRRERWISLGKFFEGKTGDLDDTIVNRWFKRGWRDSGNIVRSHPKCSLRQVWQRSWQWRNPWLSKPGPSSATHADSSQRQPSHRSLD